MEVTYQVIWARVLQVLGFSVVLVVGFSVPVEGVRVVLCDHAFDAVPHELHGLGAGLEDGHAARAEERRLEHVAILVQDRRTCWTGDDLQWGVSRERN